MNQQESPCCQNFMTVTQRNHSKVTPIGALHAEKIAEVVSLYASTIAFSLSLLQLLFNSTPDLVSFFCVSLPNNDGLYYSSWLNLEILDPLLLGVVRPKPFPRTFPNDSENYVKG